MNSSSAPFKASLNSTVAIRGAHTSCAFPPTDCLAPHHSSIMRRRHSRGHRRACSDRTEPIAKFWMPGPPVKIGNPSIEPKGTGERDLRYVECATHQWMVDLPFPQIGHPFTTICFVSYHCR